MRSLFCFITYERMKENDNQGIFESEGRKQKGIYQF